MNTYKDETDALEWLMDEFGTWFSVQDFGQLVVAQYENEEPGVPFVLWFYLYGKDELFENQSNYGYEETETYKELREEIYGINA